MAELQKLIQTKGSESSELMKLYLSEAQHSFLEHSKKGNKIGSTSSSTMGSLVSANVNNPNFLINNNNFNNTSNTATATTTNISNQSLQQSADINLNVRPPSSGNMNIGGGTGDLLNTSSPSSSMQAPSPFLDLSLADLSPLPGGINLNLGFDNMSCLPPPSGDNINGNTAYSPGNQSLGDNLSNSPMIMPNMENLNPVSPSEFFTGNMTTTVLAEPGTSPRGNANMNTMLNTNTMLSGASVCPPNLDNLKISTNANTNVLANTTSTATTMMGGANNNNANINTQQQQQQLYPNMLSPNSIKKEPTDTRSTTCSQLDQQVKHEPSPLFKTEPSTPSCMSPLLDTKEEYVCMNRLSDVERVLAEAQMTPEDSRLLLLNQVTDIIVEAHMGTTFNTHTKVAEAKERIAGCKMDPNDMVPDMSRLSLSAPALWQQFLTALVPEITKVVKFSKKLPAFSDFPQADQIKLIKQGAFEVMMARFSILVDEVNDIMLDPKLEMMSPRQVFKDLPMGPFLDEFFVIAKQFNPLRLTDGEIGLFTAILMICPDRAGLETVDAISKIQDLILQALYLLMKQNTTRTESPENTFRSLISTINHFRKVNDDHARFLNSIKMKSPSEFDQQFPPLHQEVFVETMKKPQQVE